MNQIDSLFAALFLTATVIGVAYFSYLLYTAFSGRVSEQTRDTSREIIRHGFASGRATLAFLIAACLMAALIAIMGLPKLAVVTVITSLFGALVQPTMFFATTRFN